MVPVHQITDPTASGTCNIIVTRYGDHVEIDLALKGLADPIRRRTVQRLVQGPATAGQLAALFSVSRPAVSRHLRVLREAGLVTATSSGRNIWYQAQHAALARLGAWLHDVTERAATAPRLALRHTPELLDDKRTT
jgi:DNA-binding transcriptional ArsR family regulator